MDKPNEISIIESIVSVSPYITDKNGRRCTYCKSERLGVHESDCAYPLARERYKELRHFENEERRKLTEVCTVRTIRSL